jgi:hypothetical protein
MAVDREMLEQAAASKYRDHVPADALRRLGETYLEKIIQLSLSLPPTPPDAATAFVAAQTGDPHVASCAEILVGLPPYNPRRMKRNIQTFLFLHAFSRQRRPAESLIPAILAKLVVIQAGLRDLYADVLRDGDLLAELERSVRLAPTDADDVTPSARVLRWSQEHPDLAALLRIQIDDEDSFQNVDISAYLAFFRAVVTRAPADPDESSSAATGEPAARIPWTSPTVDSRLVKRSELLALLTEKLTSRSVPTVGLFGAGGYGKTTLAVLAGQEEAVRRAFPGGLLWVTLGGEARGVDLASRINDLAEALSGTRLALVNPEQAGQYLGRLLDDRDPTLLVLDDVWDASQLQPFLMGGRRCVRLVTTRNRGVLPAESVVIRVETMSRGQVARMLESVAVSTVSLDLLHKLTGGWPLLVTLIVGALERLVADGADPEAAARQLIERLQAAGPASLDVNGLTAAAMSVSATIDASVGLLPAASRQRLAELAVFPGDTDVALQKVAHLWRATGGGWTSSRR